MTDRKPVLSAVVARNNGILIALIAPLWLEGARAVVDVTYGRGGFWTHYRPENLTCHDLFLGDGVDFRDLPHLDGTFDRVVMDPPYVAPGGRKTTGPKMADMNTRYGMLTTQATPRAQWDYIRDGCQEAFRVLEPGGLLLLKAMDYVWSGKVQWVTRWAKDDLEADGFTVEDEVIHVGGTGPQPTKNRDGSPRRQVHVRRNHSVLIVARKPRGRRRS